MQEKNKFDTNTNKKILKGAIIASGGVLVTIILQAVMQMDFAEWTPVVVGICSVLINVIHEFNQGV